MKISAASHRLWKLVFVAVMPSLLAMTCNGTPPQTSFSSSNEVLRGHWRGVIYRDFEEIEFRFVGLDAALQTSDTYEFAGIVHLGAEFEGQVDGSGSVETGFFDASFDQGLSPQMPPPRRPTFEFAGTVATNAGSALWELRATSDGYSYVNRYEGTAKELASGDTYQFVLHPIGENVPDVIGLAGTPKPVPVGDTLTFAWSAFDPAGGTLTCILSPEEDAPTYTIEDCGNDSTREHAFAEPGVYQARLEVIDSLGNSTEATVAVDVAGTAPGTLKWRFESNDALSTSPTVAPDGTIYFGTHGGNLIALEADGTPRWRLELDEPARASPTIAENGTIYIDSSPYLVAFDSEGELLWRHEIGTATSSSAAVAEDGTIYVGSGNYHLYAIDPDGTLKWRYRTENSSGYVLNSMIFASPAIGTDGTIYFGTEGGYFYALHADGTLKWRYATGLDLYSSPAIAADGTIYVGSRRSTDCFVFAFDPDGTLQWRFAIDAWVTSSPVIDSNGTIYVASDPMSQLDDAAIYAIDADGTLKWRFDTGSGAGIRATAAIGADGTIHLNGYALDPAGNPLWRYPGYGTAAFGADRTVLVADGNSLHAVNVAVAGPDPTSAWPQFQQNAGNTGRLP